MLIKIKRASILLLSLAIFLNATSIIDAAQLSSRSVRIGTSTPSTVTTHEFNFTLPTVNNLGSIEFEYCSNSPFIGSACTAPSGFSAAVAVLSTQSGETGFSIDPASNANRILLTRTAALSSAIPVSYTFSNVTNQSTAGQSVYVRISTFASIDGSGPRTDDGAVVYSTARAVSVTAYVPPYITICVGVVVALNCSVASGTQLNFGEFSRTQTRFLTSQFSVATNDVNGYGAAVTGTTMTSGNNIIPALSSPQGSATGSSQFGMNLRSNTSPPIGNNPGGIGTGAIAPNYNIANQFYFVDGAVASSPMSTEFNLYTVSYIVNISKDQKPGVYTTTLTYIASAAF